MERKFKFTKADTAAVKGIAIIFLILYHGFSIKSRLYGYPVSFWPLSEAKAMAVCRVMVQCVGIFAFLSVYGLTLVCSETVCETCAFFYPAISVLHGGNLPDTYIPLQ